MKTTQDFDNKNCLARTTILYGKLRIYFDLDKFFMRQNNFYVSIFLRYTGAYIGFLSSSVIRVCFNEYR